MEFKWLISQEDIDTLVSFVNKHSENSFVKSRIRRNLSDDIPDFSKPEFWKWLIVCLLTTQQRSGPKSKIFQFLNTNPFPLNYHFCRESKDLEKDSYDVLTNFGGIRRTSKVSNEVNSNLKWLEDNGWQKILIIAEKLIAVRKQKPTSGNIKIEREACLIAQDLKGIGPKQSRNLWQTLGLTRFEIPLDSRIIKWLNKNKFPFVLSASGLSDGNYYHLLMDGIQNWCLESDVLPCVLDAAIFSSFDEEWPEDLEIW